MKKSEYFQQDFFKNQIEERILPPADHDLNKIPKSKSNSIDRHIEKADFSNTIDVNRFEKITMKLKAGKNVLNITFLEAGNVAEIVVPTEKVIQDAVKNLVGE